MTAVDERCCEPNYEAMYDELLDKHNRLREKYAVLECDLRIERKDRKILEAQMEVVRLIFGCDGK